MSVNIPNHYAQQYATNVDLLLQQKDSRLRSLVTQGQYIGEQASPVDQVDSVEMQSVTGRFEAMPRVDADTARRWVQPQDFDLPQLIDSFDKLRLLTDPNSVFVQNAVNAAKRKMDDVIITAFFASAKTGKTGSSSTSFPSTQQVAVTQGASAATGLTVAKLREARRILRANEVDLDMDPITCVVSSKQEDNLLAEAQVISLDFNDRPVLVDGRLKSFLGMNFVPSERLAVDANSYRRVPVFAKSGMHLGIWNDITTDISQRKDIRGLPFQAYVYMTVGATRLEEKKTVEIKCSEA
jgi:hypothetical protein